MSVHEEEFKDSVKKLIELGSNHMAHSAVLGAKDEMCKKLIEHERWKSYANTLSEHELHNLIKGLILIDRMIDQPNSGYGLFGSVSPTAYLCGCFAQRFPNQEAQLTEWVVKHRVNDYDPFGTLVLNDSLSFSEHKQAMNNRN